MPSNVTTPEAESLALTLQGIMDAQTTEVVQWDAEYEVLVDQMGLMLTIGTLTWLQDKINKHLSHSKLEREAIGRRTILRGGPGLEGNLNPDYFLED